MNTNSKINQVIAALIELEAKGCHSVNFEYGNGFFRVRIFRGDLGTGTVVYEKSINLKKEQAEIDKLPKLIETLSSRVWTTVFQCYRQQFVRGKKSGNWEKVKPSFEIGENATYSMLIDGSGYYIDDPENGLVYFADMKQESKL